MTNANCLENIKCPKCGSEDEFHIEATCRAIVSDGGVTDYYGMDWDAKSYIECSACGESGAVAEFTVLDPKA